jgi:hypothetical protein
VTGKTEPVSPGLVAPLRVAGTEDLWIGQTLPIMAISDMDVLSFGDGFNNLHIGALRCRQEGASTPSSEPSCGQMKCAYQDSARARERLRWLKRTHNRSRR